MWAYRSGAMHYPANELPRIPLPRGWVNKAFTPFATANDAGNYGGGKDPARSDEKPRQHFVPHSPRPGSGGYPVALLMKVNNG